MASKNNEFSWVAEAASADCNTVEILRDAKGISVESLIAFLQKIVAANPAVAGWPVAHVECGGIATTTVVDAEGPRVVLS